METKLIEENNCLSFVRDLLENDLNISINDKQINGILESIIYKILIN